MKVYRTEEMEQLTDEWFALRWGKMSASKVDRLLKSQRMSYIRGVAMQARRRPPLADEQYSSRSAERGEMLEPFALKAFLDKSGLQESSVSCIHVTPHFVLSPDYMDDDLVVGAEIKVFEPEMMGEAVYRRVIPAKHRTQVLSYFLVPTIQEVYFVMFSPGIDNADGKDYLRAIKTTRDQVKDEVDALMIAIEKAESEIKKLRLMDELNDWLL